MTSKYVQGWHSGDDLLKTVKIFHENCARVPDLKKAKAHHEETTKKLRHRMQKYGVCSRFEYSGSAYEGIKVDKNDLEFDIMVIMGDGGDLDMSDCVPGYRFLKPKQGKENNFIGCMDKSGFLSPDGVAAKFFSELQKAVNIEGMDSWLTLKKHGPAVQMDILEITDGTTMCYSVDMVPTFYVGDEYLVAKSPKKGFPAGVDRTKAWRMSFSLKEKNKLKDIDSGNKCRKQCMRMFKVIRSHETSLRPVNSYLLKTLVFRTIDEDAVSSWEEKMLAQRLLGLLGLMSEVLEEGKLQHYYIPDINLLQDFKRDHLKNMACRLKELVRSEKKFKDLLAKIEANIQKAESSGAEGKPKEAEASSKTVKHEEDSCGKKESGQEGNGQGKRRQKERGQGDNGQEASGRGKRTQKERGQEDEVEEEGSENWENGQEQCVDKLAKLSI